MGGVGVGAMGVVLAMALAAARSAEKPAEKASGAQPKFVGVANCKLCHSDAESGDQFAQWKKSKHSQALKTLSTAKAKEIAAQKGIADPAKDVRCLKCHATAAEAPKTAKARTFKDSDSVGCESCHGPGEFYAKEEVFKKGKEAALANGLIEPDEKVCLRCHNKESPTFKEFKFKERFEEVKHPDPRKKKKA